MSTYLGDFVEDATVNYIWSTNDRNGASITRATDGSIRVYKDNGVAQKTTANGITDTEDFDSLTGIHVLTIDTSDDTGDAGFWVTGSNYTIVLEGATIDGQTVNAVLAHFGIQNRFMRGTDSANTVVPDAAGTALTATTSLTEGYAADNTAATVEEMMYMIWSALSEFAISGTTITAKKLDGSTTSMTFTLDDSATPTSRTRAT